MGQKSKTIWRAAFWKDTGERALATFLQTFVGLWLVDQSMTLWEIDLVGMGAASLSAAVLSVLKSVLAGLSHGSPSVGNVEVGDPAAEG